MKNKLIIALFAAAAIGVQLDAKNPQGKTYRPVRARAAEQVNSSANIEQPNIPEKATSHGMAQRRNNTI